LLALAETIFPHEASGLPSVQEAQVVEYIDDLLAHSSLQERLLIRCLINLLEVQMVAFNGLRPKLFSRASAAERLLNLKGWETSGIFHRRLVFMAIRTLLVFAYVDSYEVEQGMGQTPGTHVTERRNQARALVKQTLSQFDPTITSAATVHS